jgi:thiol-disulfide isomerase/thioredoxin/outer membrane protein assembly factor BamD (BamD/ComL family)
MKPWTAIPIIVFATVAQAAINVGDQPKLQFKSVKGDDINLASYKGKMVIVDFWATWCGPCMAEAPHMVQINEQYKAKGLQIIGISLDQTGNDAAKGAIDHGFNWPQACDNGVWKSAYAQSWGVDSIPQTFIISPDGIVLWRGHPALIEQPLEAAFKDHPPQLVDPKVLADANSTLDEVDQAIQSNDAPAAIKALGKVSPDAMLDGKVSGRVLADQGKLQNAGSKMLADVEPLVQAKSYLDAIAKLQDISKGFFGSPTSDKARSRLDELMKDPACKEAVDAERRQRAADDALTQAQSLQAQKKDMDAYLQFKQIAANFSGTPAADTAAKAIAVYEQNPDFVKAAKESAVAGKAKSLLNLAEAYKRAGRTDLATAKLQRVIDDYPNTSFAQQARQALDQLNADGGGSSAP